MASFDWKLDPPCNPALDHLADERDATLEKLWQGLDIDIDCPRQDYTLDHQADGAAVVYHLDLRTTIEVEANGSFEAAVVDLLAAMARNMGYELRKAVAR